MNLPSILDVNTMVSVGALVLVVIQYFKTAIPVKLIPVISLLVGILISFLFFYKVGTPIMNLDFVAIIANGVLGAIGADTGYSFLSTSKSTSLSLPSKSQLNGGK